MHWCVVPTPLYQLTYILVRYIFSGVACGEEHVECVTEVMWQGLMRDLEQREKKVNTVQATGDMLLKEGHPARSTIEARHATIMSLWLTEWWIRFLNKLVYIVTYYFNYKNDQHAVGFSIICITCS